MFGPLFSDATLPITATSNSKGSKTGTAKSTNIIGIHTGDSSIQAAAKSAGISKIYTVDVHGKCILGVYSETTVIVTGE